jgi:hypothetical protein
MTKKRITTKVITLLSGMIIAMVMIILPGGFFLNDYYHEAGSLDTEAMIYGRLLTKFISSNPDTWEFEQSRLEEFILKQPGVEYPETLRILNLKSEVVAEKTARLLPPVIMRSSDLMDSGVVAGKIEIYHSIRRSIVRTVFLFLLLLPFGTLIFILLHNVPIRALRKAEVELHDTNEKLHVLNSRLEQRVEERTKELSEAHYRMKDLLVNLEQRVRERTEELETSNKQREALILELRESLATIKQLRGILPICASCKKIRDDKGYWNQIESYIHEHSEAEFSHGICPDCAKKLYPEIYKE